MSIIRDQHVFAKTEAGAQILQGDRASLPPAARQLLILVDGQRNAGELAHMLRADAVQQWLPQLIHAGLVRQLPEDPKTELRSQSPITRTRPALHAAPSPQQHPTTRTHAPAHARTAHPTHTAPATQTRAPQTRPAPTTVTRAPEGAPTTRKPAPAPAATPPPKSKPKSRDHASGRPALLVVLIVGALGAFAGVFWVANQSARSTSSPPGAPATGIAAAPAPVSAAPEAHPAQARASPATAAPPASPLAAAPPPATRAARTAPAAAPPELRAPAAAVRVGDSRSTIAPVVPLPAPNPSPSVAAKTAPPPLAATGPTPADPPARAPAPPPAPAPPAASNPVSAAAAPPAAAESAPAPVRHEPPSMAQQPSTVPAEPKPDGLAPVASAATQAPRANPVLRVRNRVLPSLPRRAQRLGIDSGNVSVRLHVNAQGAVEKVELIKASPPQAYDQEVEKALLQWTFDAPGHPAQMGFEFVFRP